MQPLSTAVSLTHHQITLGLPRFQTTVGAATVRDLQLVQVHAFVRHGDRSALADPYNKALPTLDCSLSQAPDASLARHWPRVLAKLSDSFDVVGDGGDALDDEVWPFIAADGKQQGRSPSPPPPPTRDCRRAELTRAGVVQHLENGMVLGEAYRGPLGLGADAVAAAKAGTLRVVSTPYQRTVLSAATLVTGVFLSAAAVDDAPGDRAVDDDKVPIDLCHEESCLIFATRVSTQRCPKVRI